MLYLASTSPRRAELLTQIGVQFHTLHSEIDETPQPAETPQHLVLRLSRQKAQQARRQLADMRSDDLVIAADTLIVLDQKVLGKPVSQQDCRAMLEKLSGRRHQVMSAVSVLDANEQLEQACSLSEVLFRPLAAEEISAYCASAEPMDKAGSYAIQGRAALFIEHLSGSYSAVMGLPLFETGKLLQQFGYNII